MAALDVNTKTADANLPQATPDAARAESDAQVQGGFVANLYRKSAPVHKKNVVFSTIKGVGIGIASAIVAAAIGSSIRGSWEASKLAKSAKFKMPKVDDMVKDVSGILGITVAGFFGYNHFQKASKHNQEVEDNNQDRGR